jgi:hypothetical protein
MQCKRSVLAFTLVLVLGALAVGGCAPVDGPTTSGIATVPVERSGEVVATVAVEVTPEGTVDIEFAMALDAALAYVVARYGEQAPPRYPAWTMDLDTPEGLVGSMAYRYVAGDWVATVNRPVVAPDATVYQVVMVNQVTGFQWEGQVDNAGQVTETLVPTIANEPTPVEPPDFTVEGWVGAIGHLMPGSQFKDYFERDDGQRYGIEGATDALREQIVAYQWTGAQVRVWGQLRTDVPAYEGRSIQVERIETVSGPPVESRNLTPFATSSASSNLPTDQGGQYQSWMAMDGTLETSWVEGADGPGVGEWIELTFPGTVEVHYINLDVGYDRDDDIFYANNRVKRVSLSLSSGEQIEMELADARGMQMIVLARAPIPIQTTSVKIIIKEVYPGSRHDDTCLAEVEVWGAAK